MQRETEIYSSRSLRLPSEARAACRASGVFSGVEELFCCPPLTRMNLSSEFSFSSEAFSDVRLAT